MNYKLINNLIASQNHSSRIKKLFEESDSITIASPFLMPNFTSFFKGINLTLLKKFFLITSLSPGSQDQIKKISSLISLIEIPEIKKQEINCKISINNRLHGKVYVFKKGEEYISAIISSANFTDNGLSLNDEWGVEILDKEEVRSLEISLLKSIEFPNVTFEEIHFMKQKANDFMATQPVIVVKDIDLNLISLIKHENWNNTFLDDSINFWLKPIGVTDNPVPNDRLFVDIEDRLHFSQKAPTGVRPNDILIAYGVGSTKILCIYRVTSKPLHVTQEEIDEEGDDWLKRWPWYVEAENLTPIFGANWANHDLYINTLVEEYLALNPDQYITRVGGKTLGALNFGQDKVNLDPGFAKFVINKITPLNYR